MILTEVDRTGTENRLFQTEFPWSCPHVPRKFSDEGSLHLRFSPRTQGNTVPFPFEEPEWVMGGDQCGGCGLVSDSSVLPYARTV